ncbi:hypothetical protein V5O48_018119 [Marasmius crinis-equi]|uniref:F-box domain-containing protein n=1 Tax=Marasmius crinis-equi TaxID=585013 RepID=A0ABR3EM29_9AGAR
MADYPKSEFEHQSITTSRPALCTRCNHSYTYISQRVAHPPITKAHIRSQQFLLPSELRKLQAQITDEQLELERWNEEISRLRAVIDDMQNHRDVLSRQLSERRSLLSPSHRLPEELWLEIFSLCISRSRLGVSEDQWNKVSAKPLKLSHVCARWRNIILSSQSMWSSVYVNLYALEREVVGVLKRCLDLGYRDGCSGGGKGIDITFRHHKDTDHWEYGTTPPRICSLRGDAWTKHSENALSFLLQPENIRRFRTLSISDVNLQSSTVGGEREVVHFPLLENLFLDTQLYRDTSPMWLWKSIQQAPRLQEVVLGTDLTLSTQSLTTILAHSQIRSLEIGDVQQLEEGVLDVVRLLPTIPNLESLRAAGIRGSVGGASVECPNLRRLTIISGDGPGHEAFLRCLRLPALEFLSVESRRYASDLDASGTLISTLRDVAGTLKEFRLDYEIEPDVSVLPEILRALPNLASFSAKVEGGGKECIPSFLRELALGSGSNLRTLSLEESDSFLDFDMVERVLPLLEAEVSLALKEVRLVFGLACRFREVCQVGSERVDEAAGRLKALEKERGMKCAFFYSSWGTTTFVLGSRED